MSGAAVSLPEPRSHAPGVRFLGDDRLARLAAAGNRNAFAEIYRRYHQPLYRYCLSIVRNQDDALDALQSTAVKALNALAGEEREIAVKPWLYRIAHNESISIMRRRRDHASIDDVEPLALEAHDTDLATRERLRELVADLSELSERQRAALILRELNGLDYEEIAAVFSVSPAAAKQTVYEARTALHDRAQGREMECSEIKRALSAGDRRVARGRRIRAHVKQCAGCRDFELLMRERPAQLAALAPALPAASAAAVLQGVLGGGGGAAGGGGLLAAITGGGASSKAVAMSAATIVAGAGVIGAVTGTLPGMAGAKEGGDRPAAAQPAQQTASGSGGREAPRRTSARGGASNRGAGRGEGRGSRGERRGNTRGVELQSPNGRGGASQQSSGEQMPGLPPAGQYARPQPRPTSGAPAPVDRGGRRITRFGDTVQNLEPPPTPAPLPQLPDLPNVQLP